MTSSIGTLSRLSAGEIASHTEPFQLLFSFFLMLRAILLILFFFSVLSLVFTPQKTMRAWLQKKACFGKLQMRWKWHDKDLGAMSCTFSSLHLVFYVLTFSSCYVLLSLGLIVFTSVIIVFCIVLASTYLTPTFHCSVATVTQCSLHSVRLFML